MVRFVFLLIFISSKNVIPSEKKDSSLKIFDNHIFELTEIKDDCITEKICENAGKNRCKSLKAKFKSCSEQYKDNWIITCECLEK